MFRENELGAFGNRTHDSFCAKIPNLLGDGSVAEPTRTSKLAYDDPSGLLNTSPMGISKSISNIRALLGNFESILSQPSFMIGGQPANMQGVLQIPAIPDLLQGLGCQPTGILEDFTQHKNFNHDMICMGTAGNKFNKKDVQQKFSKLTCQNLFKPLISFMNGLYQDPCWGGMDFSSWFHMVKEFYIMEPHSLPKTVIKLYILSAEGNISEIRKTLLELRNMGFVVGPTQMAVPASAPGVSVWSWIVNMSGLRLKQLMSGENATAGAGLLEGTPLGQEVLVQQTKQPTMFDIVSKEIRILAGVDDLADEGGSDDDSDDDINSNDSAGSDDEEDDGSGLDGFTSSD
eukprot:Gregarina_sp_Poly_1__1702@NODE_1438_length_4150_cov_6_051678_g954_i0_p2_GENE_NODE_1438_length_4150_cov_6_051678_g954_i0NODE_1438_length_4150_cov_6_051678_g954_i0_p2_ORF_typecomplete_len345_score41_94_NODE_1438_length_4150_cov_6_051678_g954_i029513985